LLFAETNEMHLLQAASADGVIHKETVLPTLDTLLSVHLLHAHVTLSKITNKLTYTPLLPSIKLQSCHSLQEEEDEYPELVQIMSDLNSLFLLWEQNVAISTMTQIENVQKTNPVTVLSLKNPEATGTVLSSQSNSVSMVPVESLDTTPGAASSEDYNDIVNVDTLIAQQLVSNVSLLTSYSKSGSLRNPTESNLLTRTASVAEQPTATTSSPLPSPRNKKTSSKKKEKEKSDKKELKKKKKAPAVAAKTKSQTNIPTHGSIKIEMAPQCHLAKIEGLSEHDRVIANAMFLCNGTGYGFMSGSGGAVDPTTVSPDSPEEHSAEHLERLTSLKKQLMETETALLPAQDELNQLPLSITSSQHRNIHGTILSLYLTLSHICFQLNHRKETNSFIEKYLNYCKTNLPGDSHYLAIGLRLQLDFEEWVTAASLPSLISHQKLLRYQQLLGVAKKYFHHTDRIKDLDCELHFDAWRRLINLYADISQVLDTPGTAKPPSTETLLENLSLLTQDEIDQFEESDIAWLKLYSRIRAKALASQLTVAVKSSYSDLMRSDELEDPPDGEGGL
jgi:hypothetical protein